MQHNKHNIKEVKYPIWYKYRRFEPYKDKLPALCCQQITETYPLAYFGEIYPKNQLLETVYNQQNKFSSCRKLRDKTMMIEQKVNIHLKEFGACLVYI
jgi:hypothetical protein